MSHPDSHPASPDEARDLVRLLQVAELPTVGLDDAWATFVAVDPPSGHVIGGVAVERHATPDGPTFLLRSLVVDKSVRGTGVGTALVRRALAAADAEAGGTATVALLTESADDYFPRFGFQPTQRSALAPELSRSPELRGACPETARAHVRRADA